MIFRFFKIRKPKRFEYHPRYYDPEKEAKKELINHQNEVKKVKIRLKEQMEEKWRHRRQVKVNALINIWFVIILFILIVLLYKFLNG
jgi:hypothetical protein